MYQLTVHMLLDMQQNTWRCNSNVHQQHV